VLLGKVISSGNGLGHGGIPSGLRFESSWVQTIPWASLPAKPEYYEIRVEGHFTWVPKVYSTKVGTRSGPA
jgi:hypothetical protein